MLSNLTLYKLNPDTFYGQGAESLLERKRFVPCTPQSDLSFGWAPAAKEDGPLGYNVESQWLLEFRIEKKSVPASLIKRLVRERALEIEQKQGYKPGRRQQKELKEAIYFELLPNAFPKQGSVKVWLDLDNGVLAVNSTSSSLCDQVTSCLRDTFEGLELALMTTDVAPDTALTTWLSTNEPPARFSLDDACELKGGIGEKAGIRYSNITLDRDDVRAQLSEGMRPTWVSMTFNDRLSFVLTDKFGIKKAELLDVVEEEVEEGADKDAIFASTFVLEARELAALILALQEALGAEAE